MKIRSIMLKKFIYLFIYYEGWLAISQHNSKTMVGGQKKNMWNLCHETGGNRNPYKVWGRLLAEFQIGCHQGQLYFRKFRSLHDRFRLRLH